MSQSQRGLSRRTLFAGAGTAGAVAAVASLLPSAATVAPQTQQRSNPAPEQGGGYSLSEHVKRYYKTTLV